MIEEIFQEQNEEEQEDELQEETEGQLPFPTSLQINRKPNPNYYLKNMKPVSIDVGLEFHEKLIHRVDQSLKATKNRLQRTELLLNLEPPLDEQSHHDNWEATIEDLLSSNHRLEFPKLSRLQKQHEIRELLIRQTKSREKAKSREDSNRRAAYILAKETQNLQKKILSGKGNFGGEVAGEELRVIHNYQGCNTFDRGTRVLIRKEGKKLPESHETSLPPWFGPQYYEINYDPSVKRDATYQVAFKSPERYPEISHERIEREHVIRRRKELNSLSKASLSPNDRASSLLTSSNAADDEVASNLSEDYRDIGRGSYDNEEETLSQQSIRSQSTERDGEEEQNEDDDAAAMASQSASSNHSMELSEESLGRMLQRYDSKLIQTTRSRDPKNRLSMIPLPDARRIKQLQQKHLKRNSRKSTIHQRRPTVASVAATTSNHSFALKLLQQDDPSHKKGWKPRDYTCNALKYQRPVEYNSLFLEDTFLHSTVSPEKSHVTDSTTVVSAGAGHHPPSSSSAASGNGSGSTVRLKYSSEIFRLKPTSQYKSSDQLLKEVEAYNQEKRKGLLANRGGETKNPQSSTSNNNSNHPSSPSPTSPLPPQSSVATVSTTLPIYTLDSLENTSLTSGTSQPSGGLEKQSSTKITTDRTSLGNSVESQGSTTSPPPPASARITFSPRLSAEPVSLKPSSSQIKKRSSILKMSTKELLQSSKSLDRLSGSTGAMEMNPSQSTSALPSHSPGAATSSSSAPATFSKILNQWYRDNDIIRYKPVAQRTMKQRYQEQVNSELDPGAATTSTVGAANVTAAQPHYLSDPRRASLVTPLKKRRSIDLSLKGLLLEDNPYLTKEQQERLIEENQIVV